MNGRPLCVSQMRDGGNAVCVTSIYASKFQQASPAAESILCIKIRVSTHGRRIKSLKCRVATQEWIVDELNHSISLLPPPASPPTSPLQGGVVCYALSGLCILVGCHPSTMRWAFELLHLWCAKAKGMIFTMQSDSHFARCAGPFIDGSNLCKMGRDMMASRILCGGEKCRKKSFEKCGETSIICSQERHELQ